MHLLPHCELTFSQPNVCVCVREMQALGPEPPGTQGQVVEVNLAGQ